jgi:hypothetical protein
MALKLILKKFPHRKRKKSTYYITMGDILCLGAKTR